MPPQKKFHLVFTVLMGTTMVFIMTFVITALNVGFPADFVIRWVRAFAVAYCVALPLLYFVAPIARRLTGRLLGVSV